jgi:hypothetical protein
VRLDKIMLKLLLLLLISTIGYGQVTIANINGRVKVTSTVQTLKCTFDNIGGATTTIHINCTVPLGYILIETVTPRYTPVVVTPPGTTNLIGVGGTVGSFRDDNSNIITWMFQQLVKGIINYQITDNFGQVNVGTFLPQVVLAQLDSNLCNCFSYDYWQVNIANKGTIREKWSYVRDYYSHNDSMGRYWIAGMMNGLGMGGVWRDWMFSGEVIRDIRDGRN